MGRAVLFAEHLVLETRHFLLDKLYGPACAVDKEQVAYERYADFDSLSAMFSFNELKRQIAFYTALPELGRSY